MRALLTFLVPWTAVTVLVFLAVSGFFTRWDGRAVSIRRPLAVPTTEEPATWRVLVVEDDGDDVEVSWPAEVVAGKGLPTDALAIPPNQVPEGRPLTRKARFQLHFIVEDGDGWQTVPTTSPRSLGVAALVLLIGIGVRNMMWSGSPIAIRGREVKLPEALPQHGAPAEPPSAPRRGPPKKQPPPTRPRRGPRR